MSDHFYSLYLVSVFFVSAVQLLKMNDLQRILSDILVSSDQYWSNCARGSVNDPSDVFNMINELRTNLAHAIEHATSLHESNLQCMAQVIALRREKALSDNNNMMQIQVTVVIQAICNSVLFIVVLRLFRKKSIHC